MRVLELAQIMAGPTCGMLLADMGADVIKVEKLPGGDDSRGYREPLVNGVSAPFMMLNRNKRGIALNLKHPSGRDVLLRMVRDADVLTENYRRGTLDKLGLGYDVLAAANPGLIYCAVSGYGRNGPDADKGGFDLIAQGFAGLMSITGEPGRPPVKTGNSVADINAGILAAVGILAAYAHKLDDRAGPDRRYVADGSGAAADLLARGDLFRDGAVARPDRLGAYADGALPGVSRRATAGSTSAAPTRRTGNASPTCSAIRNGATTPRFATNSARMANLRRAHGRDERCARHAHEGRVDRGLRRRRRAGRARALDRRSARASADARARHGRRSRPSAGGCDEGARLPDPFLADADPRRRGPRRCSASTRASCCANTVTATSKSTLLIADGVVESIDDSGSPSG